MSEKIKLEKPYSDDWRIGYLQVNREGRKTVLLYNSRTERSTTAYARYLMSVKLGRYLDKNETVDHIDNDRTNDSIDNLQLLTIDENRDKYNKYYKSTIPHGTYAGYETNKCRCDLCVKAYKETIKKWRIDYYEKNKEEILAKKRIREKQYRLLAKQNKEQGS